MSTATRAATARRSRIVAGEAFGHAVARLRVVPDATARASSGAFALFVAVVLAFGLLGLLALNTLLTQGSFTSTTLTNKQAALSAQEQTLQRAVATLGSPASLALAARRLGMVPTVNPAFIDPVTGKVLGVPSAGRAAPKPVAPSPAVSATAAPSPGASGAASPKPAATPSAPAAGASPKPSSGKPSPSPTGGAR